MKNYCVLGIGFETDENEPFQNSHNLARRWQIFKCPVLKLAADESVRALALRRDHVSSPGVEHLPSCDSRALRALSPVSLSLIAFGSTSLVKLKLENSQNLTDTEVGNFFKHLAIFTAWGGTRSHVAVVPAGQPSKRREPAACTRPACRPRRPRTWRCARRSA